MLIYHWKIRIRRLKANISYLCIKKKNKKKNSIHEQGARCHFPWVSAGVRGVSSHGDIGKQLVHLIPCSLTGSVVPSLFCSGSRSSNGVVALSYRRLSCAKLLQSCPTLCVSLDCRGLLCPWDFPGKNTAVSSHSLFQGNLPNPGIKPRSPTCQEVSLQSEPPGKTPLNGKCII